MSENEEMKKIKKLIIEIFMSDETEAFGVETVKGNELMQRIFDAISEFEIKYADK